MLSYRAVSVEFIGPTQQRPSRFKVWDFGFKMFIPRFKVSDSEEKALKLFLKAHYPERLKAPWVKGGTPRGCVFVEVLSGEGRVPLSLMK